MGSCIKLAITGGIGSGKSVVSRIFQIMGVPVYDCDTRAKELMVADSELVKSLKRMFGEECYNADGSLNRPFLAARIFTDDDNIKRVNSLVHPVVIRDFKEWANNSNSEVVAVESAVLYESGLIDCVDKVLVVWSEKETAVKRTMMRSGMSRDQVLGRMQKQISSDELLLLADYSIYNDSEEPLLPAVESLLSEIRAEY